MTVHEFGHFWVARRLGFKVLRFSVGFGKTLWSASAGADGTEYVIAAVPLGGYVKMLDEREAPVAPAELLACLQSPAALAAHCVLLAGPAFNIMFRGAAADRHPADVRGIAGAPRCWATSTADSTRGPRRRSRRR